MIRHDIPEHTVHALGVARCSEAEPQCTWVGRTDAGDLVLDDADGNRFVIPAGEVDQVLELATRR
jgi:hypothetical protein